MKELAVDGIPVAVTCPVLELARQPDYRWLTAPSTDSDVRRAYVAGALFDAHRDNAATPSPPVPGSGPPSTSRAAPRP